MKKVLLHLQPSSTGLEGRMYRCLLYANMVYASYQGSFCELFNTKKYKKHKTMASNFFGRFHRYLQQYLISCGHDGKYYTSDYMSIGSKKVHDVIDGYNQEYLVTVKIEEKSC